MLLRKTFLTGILLSSLMISGAAEADGARVRTGFDRWGPAPASARTDARTDARADARANASSIVQEGRGNAAGVMQTGAGNLAAIRQFGQGNTGVIVQSGSGNTACLVQAGRNISGAVQQAGDNLSTGVLQTRWGSSDIPVDVCTAATTRQDVMAYAVRRPTAPAPGRARAAHP